MMSNRLRNGGRTSVALVAAAILTVLAVPPAAAQNDSNQQDPNSPERNPQVELIMDSSGSMNENDAGGQTRIDAAKNAMHTLVESVPDQADVGLRFYGHTYPGENKTKGCRDTELVVPVGPMDTKAAKTQIDKLEPIGFTPIGKALKEAGKDFEGDGERRIILVSDGEDTCAPPDPCDVAADLADQGIDVRIDTVGFNVGNDARKQLQCIADATGGQYGDASDADDLAAQTQEMVKQAVQGYDAVGKPVQGSREGCTDAPWLKPGQYLDHVGHDEEVWYRMKVKPGQAVQISFTSILLGSVGRGSSLDFELTPAQGEDFEDVTETSDSEALAGWANQVNVGTRTERFGWNTLRSGQSESVVCAQLNQGLDGEKKFPTEIKVDFPGEPLTYNDLPKQARSTVTKVPADAASGGSDNSDNENTGLFSPTSDSSGPNIPLAAGLAASGILLGALAGRTIGGRR